MNQKFQRHGFLRRHCFEQESLMRFLFIVAVFWGIIIQSAFGQASPNVPKIGQWVIAIRDDQNVRAVIPKYNLDGWIKEVSFKIHEGDEFIVLGYAEMDNAFTKTDVMDYHKLFKPLNNALVVLNDTGNRIIRAHVRDFAILKDKSDQPEQPSLQPGITPQGSTSKPTPTEAATPSAAPTLNPAKESMAETIRLYPAIALKDSPMNKEFVRLYNEAKQTDAELLKQSDWPMTLAKKAFQSQIENK